MSHFSKCYIHKESNQKVLDRDLDPERLLKLTSLIGSANASKTFWGILLTSEQRKQSCLHLGLQPHINYFLHKDDRPCSLNDVFWHPSLSVKAQFDSR